MSHAVPEHQSGPLSPSPTARFRRWAHLRRAGPYVAVGLVLLMMWDGIWWFSVEYPRHLQDSQRLELAAAARAAASQFDAVLGDAENSLRTVDLWLLTRSQREPLNDAQLVQLVETLRSTSRERVDVLLGTREGRFYRIPSGPLTRPITKLPPAELTTWLASAGHVGPVLGRPLQLRAGGPSYLPMAMRMSAPSGELSLLLAVIDLRRMAGLLQPFARGADGSVDVLHSDGMPLLSIPERPGVPARNFLAGLPVDHVLRLRDRGDFRSDATDNPRQVGFETLTEQRIKLLVAQGSEEILGDYLPQRKLALGLGVGITAAALLITWVLSREQREREHSEVVLQAVAEVATTMIGVLDRDRRVLLCNQAFERGFGIHREDWIGRPLKELLNATDYAEALPLVNKALQGQVVVQEASYNTAGSHQVLEMQYSPLERENGRIEGVVWIARDISEIKAEEARLRDASHTDPLTKLLNRAGFEKRAEEEMALARQRDQLLTLLYLDLDRFKPVNDQYGHPVGDALLRAVAGRIRHALRSQDLVARLGGDEFAVLLPHVPAAEHVEAVAAKLVNAVTRPFMIDTHHIMVGVSVGYCMARGGSSELSQMIAKADAWLYEAKRAGRGVYRGGYCD